jgi:hypothetical protein
MFDVERILGMDSRTIHRNLSKFTLAFVSALIFTLLSPFALGQSSPNKPLPIIKVENEGENLTRVSGVSDTTDGELSLLRSALKQQLGTLTYQLSTMVLQSQLRGVPK